MASFITKEEIEHLAKLARLKLTEKEEERLSRDLQNIVAYVTQLQEADTAGAAQKTITDTKGNFRDDRSRENTHRGKGVDQFPDQEDGYLKVPPVF